MVTELMLILIVVGAGIIFIVWTNSRKRQRNEQDKREVEDSTTKFKLELEKTANEIIGRMESQAAHLENLLDDSERNRTQLEGRVMELKKLLKRTEGQSTEIRDLLARLDDAVEDVSEMQKQMDAVERKINAAINVKIPPPPVLNSMPQILSQPLINPLMQTPPPVNPATNAAPVTPPPVINPLQSPITPPQILRTPSPAAPTPPPVEPPQEEFSKVLEKSMAEENLQPDEPVPVPRPPDRNSIVLSREIKQPAKAVEAEPVRIEPGRRRTTRQTVTKLPESIAERQARVLAERQHRGAEKVPPVEVLEPVQPAPPVITERTAKIREAAVAAINNAVEKENTVEVELSPVEELQSNEKIQSLKTKAATLGERQPPPEPPKFDSNPDSANIRDMLLAGMTVEEIAKETGLGRGAIELVQQMARRQLERK